jgi:aconitate decarboxylase
MPAALTQLYADFAANWQSLAIPAESLAVARLGFTDCVGVMLAGRHEDAVKRLASHVLAQGATPKSRMAGATLRVSMAQAGLVNATAAHALDYDDFAFSNHPSAVLVPTVLAAADACSSVGGAVSGRQMVAAYLVGYEVWADLMLREKDLFYDKGWHPTAVLGPIGAAAAASVVLGLNASQAKDALALAASDSGGVFENFGTMAKPWHGGRAAAAGLNAAGLAAAGLVASGTALEGKFGLMRALSPRGEVDLETPPQVGHVWRSATMRLNIKKYPTVGASQRCIDAVLALNQLEKIDPARITKIIAHISERHAAVMPYHLPQDAMQAKFSLEFAIASALVYGAVGFKQLDDAVVRLPAIQRLMSLVVTETTAEFEPDWRDAAPFDIVHFTLDDGRVVSTPQVRRASGHADTPLSNQALWEKFLGCAHHGGIAESIAAALFETLQRVDQLQDVAEIELPE